MAELLSGKAVAEALTERMKADVVALKAKGLTPTLGIIRVGEKGPDISYEKGATKRCEEVGAAVKNYVLPEDATQEALLKTIAEANADRKVHGVLLFRPLPKHIDDNAARAALNPAKDVDGITDGSMAGIYSDSGAGYPPCTAESVIRILDHYKIDPAGKRVAVLGRSTVIGKPVSLLLLKKNGTVTICHSKTQNLAETVKAADIVVVAMGRALSVGKEYFRAGQYVIDVGVNPKPNGEKGTCGDVKFDEAEPVVAGISPVPGGVGAVTNACLVAHVIAAVKAAQ
ncbi:bifunctional 5,10-methylenetetrahydrofolate dehydrogenase/5,10-methenyltetrahydrofolate cyclohydrolase [Treponema endosymbiont of Eucomonympha sp.]|uniref:bifunctional 5,10-methylenetetrahydrofolate dehydrogenase/5,10-methenyltetrahydrofolate cyclohydrolase n=1 Tax=Treponema endosymbiont of Eucomonympha sp. TaxID=1580831 RepID=UPI000784BEA2|nr:bifunctional 5,10-methylenetetrahydrofolate dehydrogenase/5,10-methenyltetrahydrofolate cyclohydrolase [Treponema endosymbiont of Eucomonympha sp.]